MFDRKNIDSDFLMVSKMLRDLNYRRLCYSKGTDVRDEFECSIVALEKLKKVLSDKINERSEKERNEEYFKQ